jgi:hypothetical protein
MICRLKVICTSNDAIGRKTVLSPRMAAATCILGSILGLTSCGGGGNSNPGPPPPPPSQITSVAVTPGTGQLRTGDNLLFTAEVEGTGPFNRTVVWSVQGINGGDAAHGFIVGGQYTAPATPPNPNIVSITATSVQDTTKFATASATVYSIAIIPVDPTVPYGHTQQFIAQVTGITNPTMQWFAQSGTFTPDGLYTATTLITQPVGSDVVTAAVVGGGSSVSENVTLVIPPPILTSITPNGASAGEQVTFNGQDFYGPTQVVFTGINGTQVSQAVEQISYSQISATIPFGAATGPAYLESSPLQGINETSNSISFTRLPNLRVHAATKDLSSGEMMQFDWRLLGSNSPMQVDWTAESGSISSSGLFQAPVVSGETFTHVTGCLRNTQSCNTVLLRILPFRVVPPAPVVDLGNTLQLDAIQGSSVLTAQWSVLAGGGNIGTNGLFTAPNSASQAGPVPVVATVGSTSEQTSVAVSGAFPGIVNRIYDYVDFHNNMTSDGTFASSVAVQGNRAYALTLGAPFEPSLAYASIDVYDMSNPDQPVWIDAVESANNLPSILFISGNNLFGLDPSKITVYSLQGPVPSLTGIVPISAPWTTTVNDGMIYAFPVVFPFPPTSFPIDIYDVHTGTIVRNHYDLPTPPDDQPAELWGISGRGKNVYISWVNDININPRLTIATYDVSTSPPTLVATLLTDVGFNLHVANQFLFANRDVYDISNVVPVKVATLPLGSSVWGVQGNQVLVSGAGANNVVVDLSDPTKPRVAASVADIPSENIFISPSAAWATPGRFITTDGPGGFAVHNVAADGGPSDIKAVDYLAFTYDMGVQQQTLYAAGVRPSGDGGLVTFDLSSGSPTVLGSLFYPGTAGLALQVSGNNLFLGLADSLKTIDVLNPSSPIQTASLPIPTNALVLSGTTLFAGTRDGRLVVLDVSNPSAPHVLATLSMLPPTTMRLSGSLLFAATGFGGMIIFDVSQPASPVMLSHFAVHTAPVWDVAPLGSVVVLAADKAGVVTVDVSDPSQPKLLSQQQLPLLNAFPAPHTVAGFVPALSLAVHDGLTYVGTTAGLLFAFDSSQPANPRLVTLEALGGDLAEIPVITQSGNNLYVAIDSSVMQLENSLPRNSIELYYPPAALSNPFQIQDSGMVREEASNSKLNRMWSTPKTGLGSFDRFGFPARTPRECTADALVRENIPSLKGDWLGMISKYRLCEAFRSHVSSR